MSLFDKFFGRNKASKEIAACEGALEKRPNDTMILKKLGDLYLKAENFKNASDVYVRLGEIYSDKGFYPKAIALYKQAIKINPTWEGPYEKLAELYQVQGFSREAATQYVKLSEILEQSGDSVEATMYMQKAAELDPAINQVSRKVHSFKVKEKAMTEPVPKTAPKPEVERTDFYDLTKELDTQLEKELEEFSIDETYDDTVDTTGVESVFKAIQENAAQEVKDDPLFQYNMGLAYRETGLLDEAIDAFRKVVGTGEKLYDAFVMLGITYRERGLFHESLDSLRQAVSLEEASTDMKVGILYEIAQTYKALGDNSNALSIFREIQKDHKDFKDVELEIVRLAGGG
ncbi:MAG TPA: tetratricopeptide repeat protein [Deltaproteobacteria bacterium]|jgi:tetratricopeptide (TPR) repeat protein|nr:MAG: photosystem I assembly protein Ycf3 [Deltaproteobacteria bacterium ADurb.Bin072]HNQ85331.1 tetratricopeptide repeat protein [Deltaproteobacteria bacterium]HRW80176.1 tetratricopeptide repeat protein [Desulfomonilia bacterium]HNS89343.1 tetratricopeptide repeat protein [Deltaproteobacteria bacterium]HOA43979.1 tetratricopeptide repeat protein [Deltaproteobacteria bacterium]